MSFDFFHKIQDYNVKNATFIIHDTFISQHARFPFLLHCNCLILINLSSFAIKSWVSCFLQLATSLNLNENIIMLLNEAVITGLVEIIVGWMPIIVVIIN